MNPVSAIAFSSGGLRGIFHSVIGEKSDYANTEIPQGENQADAREQVFFEHEV